MVSSLFLSLREGLEASLVVAIILTYLLQSGRKGMAKYIYYGTFLGIAGSLIFGFIGFREAQELGRGSEEVFEGAMMLLASGLIGYFVVWMGNQAGSKSADIKSKVSSNSSAAGLLVLSFLSVFREGLELCIFTLTKINEKATDIAIGSGIGLAAAVILTYIIFKTSIRFNLKIVFKVLGLILIYIGAEMFSEGILKFITLDEIFEAIFMAIFIVPSLYFFLKNDIVKDKVNQNTLGLDKIALIGSPNVGKSVLFNALTGAYVTVSNYPGTTVEVSRGKWKMGGKDYEVIDTPGMYSLMCITDEEKVTKDLLLKERPSIVLHVIDAKNIQRMLPLTFQLIEGNIPVMLVLNIMDEAERMGIHIDVNGLEKELGIPVVSTVAALNIGIDTLKERVQRYVGTI